MKMREPLPTLDLAVGADLGAQRPLPSGPPLPFPRSPSVQRERPHRPGDDSSASRTLVSQAPVSSPWAPGGLTRARNAVRPPPTPERAAVEPPPLMLVSAASEPIPATLPDSRLGEPRDGLLADSERIELIGWQQDAVDRVRRRWSGHDEPPRERLVSELRAAFEGEAPREPDAGKRQIQRVLRHASATPLSSLGTELRRAFDDESPEQPALILAAGELELHLDALERLKATVASVASLLPRSEALRAEVVAAQEILAEPGLQGCPEACEELAARVRRVACEDAEADDRILGARVEAMLVAAGRFQTRAVLGVTWVRASLKSGAIRLPCYLPGALLERAPLFTRIPARLIGELHPRQEQTEASPYALVGLCLGRIIRLQETC